MLKWLLVLIVITFIVKKNNNMKEYINRLISRLWNWNSTDLNSHNERELFGSFLKKIRYSSGKMGTSNKDFIQK